MLGVTVYRSGEGDVVDADDTDAVLVVLDFHAVVHGPDDGGGVGVREPGLDGDVKVQDDEHRIRVVGVDDITLA